MSRLPVTDQELMLFVDGELPEDRAAEVEAELERSARAREVVASLQHAGAALRWQVDDRAQKAGADSIVDDVMAQIEAERAGKVVPLQRSETSRSERAPALGSWGYALGGLAAAAAAALVIWRLVGAGLTPELAHDPAPSALPPTPGTEVASARVPAPDYDPEPTVSVDAVDFGARTGTIFYVPADKGTTTIVWLADDESGGM